SREKRRANCLSGTAHEEHGLGETRGRRAQSRITIGLGDASDFCEQRREPAGGGSVLLSGDLMRVAEWIPFVKSSCVRNHGIKLKVLPILTSSGHPDLRSAGT